MKCLLPLLCAFTLLQGCGGGNATSTPVNPAPSIASANTQKWMMQFGTGTVYTPPQSSLQFAGDHMAALVAAPNGGVYAAGYTIGAFPTFIANPNHIMQPYVAHFDNDGNQTWLRQVSTSDHTVVRAASADSAGNLYASGGTLGAFAGYSNDSHSIQAFLLKFASDGTQLWARQFAINNLQTQIYASVIDASGTLFISGLLQPTSGQNFQNIFVAAVDPSNGSLLWSQVYGNNSIQNIGSLTVDGSGGLYLSGDTSGTFPGNATDLALAFVAKLKASDGSIQWTQLFSEIQTQAYIATDSIAVAPDGDLVVGGALSSGFIIVGQYASVDAKLFLCKLSSATGDLLWQQTYSSGSGDQISSVQVLKNGSIYAAGVTNGTFNPAFTAHMQNLFLLKTDSSGRAVWVEQFGTGDIKNVQDVYESVHLAVDSSGDLLVGGATQGAYSGASNPSQAVEGFIGMFGN